MSYQSKLSPWSITRCVSISATPNDTSRRINEKTLHDLCVWEINQYHKTKNIFEHSSRTPPALKVPQNYLSNSSRFSKNPRFCWMHPGDLFRCMRKMSFCNMKELATWVAWTKERFLQGNTLKLKFDMRKSNSLYICILYIIPIPENVEILRTNPSCCCFSGAPKTGTCLTASAEKFEGKLVCSQHNLGKKGWRIKWWPWMIGGHVKRTLFPKRRWYNVVHFHYWNWWKSQDSNRDGKSLGPVWRIAERT